MAVLAVSPPGPLTRLKRGIVKYVLMLVLLLHETGWIKLILSMSLTEKSSAQGKAFPSLPSLKPTLQLSLSAALAAAK